MNSTISNLARVSAGTVLRYYQQTARYPPNRFIWELAILPFPFKVFIGIMIAPFLSDSFESTTAVMAAQGDFILVFSAVILAPIVETLVGQWLPIWLISLATRSTLLKILGSAVIFTSMHLQVGLAGVLPILPVGIILSWSFLIQCRHSRTRAYWITTLIHATHNALSLIVFFLMPG
jgi:hypothetical protein